MCGIFGVLNVAGPRTIDKQQVEAALETMRHRGPNALAYKLFDGFAALGHLRLAIIDLDTCSNQPFEMQQRFWLSFNGEIYNYIELRQELEAEGYRFRTRSDTEVLLASYIAWGSDCVKRFNGMWAFAIYDSVENKLFCSRDRFGVKPFNYSLIDGQFVFASEIKAILRYCPSITCPNYPVIANYVRVSLGAQIEETWFKGILRLKPAHSLIVTAQGIQEQRYWDYPRNINTSISFAEAVSRYRELFQDSVRLRMRSDMPVGFTLSSGIDSTSLVCSLDAELAKQRKTYTAAFGTIALWPSEKANFRGDPVIDEPAQVQELAEKIGFSPTIISTEYDNYVADMARLIWHLESGHGSPAVFPLSQVLKRASSDVTVVLEGQGADELLGGYISNVMPVYFLQLIKSGRIIEAISELRQFCKTYSLKNAMMLRVRQSKFNLIKRAYYQVSGLKQVLGSKLKDHPLMEDYPAEPVDFQDDVAEHLFKAHTGGLVNLLHYGDAISMAYSLESRLPFMDYRLVEFVFTLPSSFKVRGGVGKYIHKVAMEGIVPDFILRSAVKIGFDSPLAHVFLNEKCDGPMAMLLSERCTARGLFTRSEVERLFKELKSGKSNHSRLLYRMLSVELWFREFIDEV